MTPALNHLWQSTVFAFLAALLAIALRKNHAQTRYWVWMAASLKFLIPFSVLVSIGSQVPLPAWMSRSAPAITAQPSVAFAIDEISRPFPVAQIDASAAAPAAHSVMPVALIAIWVAGCAIVLVYWFRRWLRVRAALRRASPVGIDFPIQVMSSPSLIEPGIFGIFRPVLLLPEGIADRLTPAQLHAILAHELCHVRRRDNLSAAIHMLVEAAFWFHPLVWWIGARLIEERERACDEEVLVQGSEPGVYAESILQVCKFYLESPLECAAGVTGSDLKKRVEKIMSGRFGRGLTTSRKLMLAIAGVAAVATPMIVGVLNAPVIRAQNAPANTPTFEVASIKACKEPLNIAASGVHSSPGRLATDCNELLNLIGNAYNGFADGHLNLNSEPAPINGGPAWLRSASYDINAKAEGNPSVAMMLGPMMQKLLEDRFQLKIHRQTSEGPVYFLTGARGGSKLHPFQEGSCAPWSVPPPPLEPGTKYCGNMINGISPSIEALGATLDEFSKTLRLVVHRPVVDKTGITGRFDIRVEFSREGTDLAAIHLNGPSPATDSRGVPSIFTALQEQIGLKLEPGRGPVESLVIDHIEKPTDNFEQPIAAAPQASEKPALKFEGASIRPNATSWSERFEHPMGGGYQPDGRLTMSNASLLLLIQFAYAPNDNPMRGHSAPLLASQVVGGPSWINSMGYDIDAKPPSGTDPKQMMLMLQTLLADRFKLAVHTETKELPIYALTAAKAGLKLPPAKAADCISFPPGTTPHFVPGKVDCGYVAGPFMADAGMRMQGSKVHVADLIRQLALALDRPVLDKTGFAGEFDLDLTFAPDGTVIALPGSKGPNGSRRTTDSNLPNIFLALEQQLGLKLEASKGPVETLVVDHAEKPTEN